MDEPCSALDPIATAKVEELIRQLKEHYTIVIVTHNMQQAGRCSDHTAFFYLGRLIEFGEHAKIFSNPAQRQTEETSPARSVDRHAPTNSTVSSCYRGQQHNDRTQTHSRNLRRSARFACATTSS